MYGVGNVLRAVAVTAAVACVLLLVGCGGGSTPPPMMGLVSPQGTDAVSLDELAVDDGLAPRWMDVDDTRYTAEFKTAYSYSTASVTASYSDPSGRLVIALTGSGLKPNHAYQVKLEGLPSDPQGNQILGDLGRWWEGTGYLIFGYFVTDGNGEISVSAPVDSSYHVLWKTSQRRPSPQDGPVINHQVVRTDFGYDNPGTGNVVGVYGEWERGRPKPGKLVLPDHTYTCLLRLTEESFHSTAPDGGGWKSVLDAEITFTIGAGSPEPPPSSGTMHVASIVMTTGSQGVWKFADAKVSIVDDTGIAVPDATVSGAWSGLVEGTASGTTGSDGTVTFRSPRTRTTSGTFKFTVTGVAKDGWEWDTENSVTTASITIP